MSSITSEAILHHVKDSSSNKRKHAQDSDADVQEVAKKPRKESDASGREISDLDDEAVEVAVGYETDSETTESQGEDVGDDSDSVRETSSEAGSLNGFIVQEGSDDSERDLTVEEWTEEEDEEADDEDEETSPRLTDLRPKRGVGGFDSFSRGQGGEEAEGVVGLTSIFVNYGDRWGPKGELWPIQEVPEQTMYCLLGSSVVSPQCGKTLGWQFLTISCMPVPPAATTRDVDAVQHVDDDALDRSTEMRDGADSLANSTYLCRGTQGHTDKEADKFLTAKDEGSALGDVVLTNCDAANLIATYEEDRGSNTDDDPAADLAAMHQSHIAASSNGLRRSVRVQNLPPKEQAPLPEERALPRVVNPRKRKSATNDLVPHLSKQKIPPLERLPRTKEELKWVARDGKLTGARHTWSVQSGQETTIVPVPGSFSIPTTPCKEASPGAVSNVMSGNYSAPPLTVLAGDATPTVCATEHTKRRSRGGYGQKNNHGRDSLMEDCTYSRGDAAVSPTFSVIHDASVASTGWQGKKPTPIARARIDHLYHLEDDAAALYPTEPERGTFILDKNGIVFAYRSWRALWLADLITDLETAQAILVGNDLKSKTLKAASAKSARGPHLPIILGHQRHGWVSSVFRTIWPGLAARFEEDAAYHLAEHGIKPLFGYFWNFCFNASSPGQARIHTGPHADCKNQVGVCMILVYVLKHGIKFNHKFRSWIVLWEAELAIEMPPWVLTGYPSALFYHFNIDVHRVDKPTRENSRPIVDGDEAGRGSMVFFSQSTMRHGPATGFDTLKMAIEAGHSGTTHFGDDMERVFQKAAVHTKITEEDLEAEQYWTWLVKNIRSRAYYGDLDTHFKTVPARILIELAARDVVCFVKVQMFASALRPIRAMPVMSGRFRGFSEALGITWMSTLDITTRIVFASTCVAHRLLSKVVASEALATTLEAFDLEANLVRLLQAGSQTLLAGAAMLPLLTSCSTMAENVLCFYTAPGMGTMATTYLARAGNYSGQIIRRVYADQIEWTLSKTSRIIKIIEGREAPELYVLNAASSTADMAYFDGTYLHHCYGGLARADYQSEVQVDEHYQWEDLHGCAAGTVCPAALRHTADSGIMNLPLTTLNHLQLVDEQRVFYWNLRGVCCMAGIL
ncbi:hypothetical protein C8R43DRAFT_961787 [Mycena crocata]|nr:hypothetical protein C8R43DRAFT_961787 [Mycena crocata]